MSSISDQDPWQARFASNTARFCSWSFLYTSRFLLGGRGRF
eukprot:CAMPEP_0176288270 /NCGR_PEP_ID=MMETSP0121_2-20121125/53883_1 /TAXON_ID=160619 /ORGANISM="Kryptoperidinium foliaceum, Strain CCMP 1326" /LENGTH=40 /DNA_ID= /DNA_START= /DNA_END= /DNA_ORIENTATION=